MNLDILKAELTDDPLTRGYSGFSDVEVAADLNTVYREKNKTSMTGSEVINAVDATEWAALSIADQTTVWNIAHLGMLNPFGVEATMLIGIFGAGSDTITALAAARVEAISRAAERGFGTVRAGDVQRARA